MMRPDRFPAVFGLSVPFSPRGEKSFLQAMIEAGHPDFYMFSRMLPTAEAVWSKSARAPASKSLLVFGCGSEVGTLDAVQSGRAKIPTPARSFTQLGQIKRTSNRLTLISSARDFAAH